MHTQRIAVAIAAAIGAGCTFLPWANVPIFGSVDGTELNDYRAWITAALCAMVGLGAIVGNHREPLSSLASLACGLAGFVTGGIALWTIVELFIAMESSRFGFNVGFGLYLLAVTSLAIVLLPTKFKTPKSPARPDVRSGEGSR